MQRKLQKALGRAFTAATASSQTHAGGPGKKACNIWSLDRDIERTMKTKLGFIDPVDLKSRRNAQKQSVLDYLQAALASCQTKSGNGGKRQYLNAAFWSEFFDSFGFNTVGFHGLRAVSA